MLTPEQEQAAERLRKHEYLDWQSAGGPNECMHGYAEGVPCPTCDRVFVADDVLRELAIYRQMSRDAVRDWLEWEIDGEVSEETVDDSVSRRYAQTAERLAKEAA